jgi:biopolymer transport protein ExbD
MFVSWLSIPVFCVVRSMATRGGSYANAAREENREAVIVSIIAVVLVILNIFFGTKVNNIKHLERKIPNEPFYVF